MIPTSFEYKRANSVDEAISMIKANGGTAKLIAGGHSLLPAMKLRLNSPETLIDISRVAEMRNISMDGNELVIGAACTHAEMADSEIVKSSMAMISQAAGMIGDVQVRNFGTLGGSLAHADPAADWPGVVLAAESKIIVKGPGGKRTISADDFFTGFFETALADNEIITQVRIPTNPPGTGKLHSVYLKFPQPASRFAIVGCAVVMRIDRGPSCTYARVAFNGVSDTAYRDTAIEKVLTGQLLNDDVISKAANLAGNGKTILSDPFASEGYRQHLTKVFARRAIEAIVG